VHNPLTARWAARVRQADPFVNAVYLVDKRNAAQPIIADYLCRLIDSTRPDELGYQYALAELPAHGGDELPATAYHDDPLWPDCWIATEKTAPPQ
jgi:hypothetical protein